MVWPSSSFSLDRLNMALFCRPPAGSCLSRLTATDVFGLFTFLRSIFKLDGVFHLAFDSLCCETVGDTANGHNGLRPRRTTVERSPTSLGFLRTTLHSFTIPFKRMFMVPC